MTLMSSVRWKKVLVVSAATYLSYGVLIAVTIVLYTLPAIGSAGEAPGLIDALPGLIGVWGLPVLTIFGAAWAARRAEPRDAVVHGLLVGLLVAIGPLLGPLGPPSPLAAALTVATSLLGGWLGSQVDTTGHQAER